jgi:hypothetical protein
MRRFLDALREQRWDDHRYYHHSRVNQSLHFFSSCCFLATYALLATRHFLVAVVFGWMVAMVSRQIGHFFFEPKGYDDVNHATHEYKEAVKVGYNLRRKVILHSVWGAAPLLLLVSPTFFGVFKTDAFLPNLAELWLVIAGAALLGRTIQLFFIRNALTGVVWFTKILTDPFNDFWQYRGAPLALLRGERLDPMLEAQHS